MLKVNLLLIMEMSHKIWDSVINLSEVVLGLDLGEAMEMNTHSIIFMVLLVLSNIIHKVFDIHQHIGMLMILMSFALVAVIKEDYIIGIDLVIHGDGVEIGMVIGMDADITTNISHMPGMKLLEFNTIIISGEDTIITAK